MTHLLDLPLATVSTALHTPAARWLLPAQVALPAGAALVLLTARRLSDRWATGLAAAAAGATLVLGVLAAIAATPFRGARPGLSLDLPWIPALGVRLHLGVDGVSAPLVVLTGALGLLVTVHLTRVHPLAGRPRALAACYLATVAGSLAALTALDLVLFFLAFESVLIPMWFVIAFWGDDTQIPRSAPPLWPRPGGAQARRQAAYRFVLFTAAGSAAMLLGLLLVASRAGTTDLVVLAAAHGRGLDRTTQLVAAALLVVGLAVKAPAFPFHTWLPAAHTIAPTGGSVLLAGVLLKLGTYGLVRLVVPVVPRGAAELAPYLGAAGAVGVVWAGLACFAERDLKRLVALSSVAHLGFVLLGIASLTPTGLQGALFANVAHGVITGLLFLVVGALKDRWHSADLVVLARSGALRDRLPGLGRLLVFGAVAAIGVPGLAGFWGELLALAGAWQSTALGSWARPLAVVGALGTVVAATYLLRVLRVVWQGRVPLPAGELEPVTMGDTSAVERTVMIPLVVAVLGLGLFPGLLLQVTGAAVRVLLVLPEALP